jgi:hypothetical protein
MLRHSVLKHQILGIYSLSFIGQMNIYKTNFVAGRGVAFQNTWLDYLDRHGFRAESAKNFVLLNGSISILDTN